MNQNNKEGSSCCHHVVLPNNEIEESDDIVETVDDCCSTGGDKIVVQPNKEALLKRMNRIIGQTQGLSRMMQDDRYCVDILIQISAVKSALDSVAMQLLENHTHHCVRRSIQSGQGEREIVELLDVFKKYVRL